MISNVPSALQLIRVAAADTTRALANIVTPINQLFASLKKVTFPYVMSAGSLNAVSGTAGAYTSLRFDNANAANIINTDAVTLHSVLLTNFAGSQPVNFYLYDVPTMQPVWSTATPILAGQNFAIVVNTNVKLTPFVPYLMRVVPTTTGNITCYAAIKVME